MVNFSVDGKKPVPDCDPLLMGPSEFHLLVKRYVWVTTSLVSAAGCQHPTIVLQPRKPAGCASVPGNAHTD